MQQEMLRPGRDVPATRAGDIHPQVERATRSLVPDAPLIEQHAGRLEVGTIVLTRVSHVLVVAGDRSDSGVLVRHADAAD